MPLAFDLATYSTAVTVGKQLRQFQLLRDLDKLIFSKMMTLLIQTHLWISFQSISFQSCYRELNKDKLILPSGKQDNKAWNEKQPNLKRKIATAETKWHRYLFTSPLTSPYINQFSNRPDDFSALLIVLTYCNSTFLAPWNSTLNCFKLEKSNLLWEYFSLWSAVLLREFQLQWAKKT